MDDNKFDDFFEEKEESNVNNNHMDNNMVNHEMNDNHMNNDMVNHEMNNNHLNNDMTNHNMNNNHLNNNMTNHNMNNNHMNNNVSYDKPKKGINNKKIPLIIGGVVLGVIILLFIIGKLFGSGSSSYNGYTANAGDTLKVNEIGGIFNLKVLSPPERYVSTEQFLFKGNYIRLQVEIDNRDSLKLALSIVNFSLLDSSKQEIATSNLFFPNTFSGILKDDIPARESKTGYIYFEADKDDKGVSDAKQSTIDNAYYLEVSVMAWIDKKAYKESGIISTKNEQYYLALK